MKLFKLSLLLLIPFISMTNASAVTAVTASGTNYQAIVPPQPTSTEGKIEVIEIFSYGCSHCHRFEPILERWLKNKPDNVEFIRMPAIFSPVLALYARAYYAAEALAVTDKIHQPFFEAIHMQKRQLNTEEAIAELFAENGVDTADFKKAFRSFAVEAKVRRAAELGKRYGIQATPSMIVNGKYRTNPSMTQGFKNMVSTVNMLVERESGN